MSSHFVKLLLLYLSQNTGCLSRHANHSAFGGIIPHFRHFSAIPRGICEIPLFYPFNV